MNTKKRKLTVELDASTFRWLRALARGNSKTKMQPGVVTAEDLLAQAAFCMADHAGRRTGSWEASVAESLLSSSGYQDGPKWDDAFRCHQRDDADQKAWRENYEATDASALARRKAAYSFGDVKVDDEVFYCEAVTPDGKQAIDLTKADAEAPDLEARLMALAGQIEDVLAGFDFAAVATAMHALKWHWHGQHRSPTVSDLRRGARSLLLDSIGCDGGMTSGGFSAERSEDGFYLAFELRKSHL